MLELGLRDPGNLKQMDFHKYSFSKLAFMLNVTRKSEMRRFQLHEVLSLPKLESSRNVASKVKSNRIKARKSKSTEQYDSLMIARKLFFRLDGTCNLIVELSNSTG